MSVVTAVAQDNHRINQFSPLLSPALLRHELPAHETMAATVAQARAEAVDILDGRDDRLLVVVGPCSIHDTDAALEYAHRLARLSASVSDELRIVMRAYFEKPRTTVGWKGLINDPHLDGTFDVNTGLRLARRLLLDVLALGLPVGCEFLDPITPQFLTDLVAWGSIGARTAASQTHRQLCSGLSMPVGIKNTTSGEVADAVDGIRAAAAPHVFMGVNADGLAALVSTAGNPDCHLVLRGGANGPNYSAEHVAAALGRLRAAGLPERVIIDASHGNSGKDHARQPVVAGDIAARIAGGERGIAGVMLESFLVAGRQDVGPNMTRGQSVTDACMAWDTTESTVQQLAAAVRARR
ncbi:3-deoxy-7-phosphoheptulonate synthase [Kibdelosporangium persicum]|uniref:Phospho-2-dehydro-3-deoxyheptonate aldolase n=1 Tax=Kibdelosporangium persicum TaxID=2698649 RepID=A0ABX2F2B6_9PSEU|nr:3-deoxy-7-phosphoheptulonate synthase [Kibdelosporangium persicum]NRN65135.1 3-deoxy-D-arabinoheptulosonate-7-phosphate synthase [Kibdelosporangium persicum]